MGLIQVVRTAAAGAAGASYDETIALAAGSLLTGSESIPQDLEDYDPLRLPAAALKKGTDFQSFASAAELIASGFFSYGQSKDPNVDLDDQISLEVDDPVWGQFVRYTHVPGSAAIPQLFRGTFSAADQIGIRTVFRLSQSPAYTTAGSGGSGGNSQKWQHIHMPGGGETARTRIDLEGSFPFTFGFSYPGRTFTETLITPQPGGTTAISAIHALTTIRDSGEWWESMDYHEKTGTYTGRHRAFFRQLTSAGAFSPGGQYFSGRTYVSNPASTYEFPQAHEAIYLVNRNRTADVAMYIDVARCEIVNLGLEPDAHGVADIGT